MLLSGSAILNSLIVPPLPPCHTVLQLKHVAVIKPALFSLLQLGQTLSLSPDRSRSGSEFVCLHVNCFFFVTVAVAVVVVVVVVAVVAVDVVAVSVAAGPTVIVVVAALLTAFS